MGEITKITSAQNSLIKDTAKLKKANSKPGTGGVFLLEGFRLCNDAFVNNVAIEKAFFTDSFFEKQAAFIAALQEKEDIALYQISDFLGEKLADTKSPQGVFMVCNAPPKGDLENLAQTKENVLVLDGIADPGNMGTIVRTAFGLGFKHILLLNNCTNPLGAKALRASMGSVFGVTLYLEDNSELALRKLKNGGYIVYTSALHKDSVSLQALQVHTPCCLVIGSEANGVGEKVTQLTDTFVEIEMAKGAESLNAATAAGILIWEFSKQV